MLHYDCTKREAFVLYSKYDYGTVEIQSSLYIKPHLGIKNKKLKHKKIEDDKIWIIDATRGQLIQHDWKTKVKYVRTIPLELDLQV